MKVTVELEVEIQFVDTLLEGDLPIRYWGRTMASHPTLGRLVREHDAADADGDAALLAWAQPETALPKGWHRLDEDAAVRAWVAGVRRWGERWYVDGDAARVDVVVQEALLGAVTYG